MPVINFNYQDLCKILGKKVPKEELLDRIPMIGADMHSTDGNTDEFSVEFFPDRPDLYTVEGFARSMRSFLSIKRGIAEYNVLDHGVKVEIENDSKNVNEHTQFALVTDIEVCDSFCKSLYNVFEKLDTIIGGKKRSKISISIRDLNYVKFPLTIKLDDSRQITVRDFENKGITEYKEQIKILEKDRIHTEGDEGFKGYPHASDKTNAPILFAPTGDGFYTEITRDTRNVFIIVTGTNERTVKCALNIISTMMAERGGKIVSVEVHDNGKEFLYPDLSPSNWEFSLKDCERFLGVKIGWIGVKESLEKMGLNAEIRKDGDTVDVRVPSTRLDIMHVVDIYGDVAIGYGFEKFGFEHNVATQTSGKLDPTITFSEKIRDIMIGMGFNEAVTLTLSCEKDEFDYSGLPKREVTTVMNPITKDHTCLRASLFPSLMKLLKRNKHRDLPQRLFEVSDVVIDAKKQRRLCAVIMHSKTSFTEIKSYAETVLREIGVTYTLRPSDYKTFIDGRGAEIVCDNDTIGYFGEVSPEVITNFEITHPVIMFEIVIQPFVEKVSDGLL